MSVIGPRPALWNQDVLTAERDKYGAREKKYDRSSETYAAYIEIL